MNAKPNYDLWHLKVTPRSKGNYGTFSIGSMHYDQREAEDLQAEMSEAIKRHIDHVHSVDVEYEEYLCECGRGHESERKAKECCTQQEVAKTDTRRIVQWSNGKFHG